MPGAMIFAPGAASQRPGREKTSPGQSHFARDGEKSPGVSSSAAFRKNTEKNDDHDDL